MLGNFTIIVKTLVLFDYRMCCFSEYFYQCFLLNSKNCFIWRFLFNYNNSALRGVYVAYFFAFVCFFSK